MLAVPATRQIAWAAYRAHAPRTECDVDGTYARRSTPASRSSPAAAQRCAEGAGLDGDDRGRSTIKRAVHRTADTKLQRCHDPTALRLPRKSIPACRPDPRARRQHRSIGARGHPAASPHRISTRPFDDFKPVVFDQFHVGGDMLGRLRALEAQVCIAGGEYSATKSRAISHYRRLINVPCVGLDDNRMLPFCVTKRAGIAVRNTVSSGGASSDRRSMRRNQSGGRRRPAVRD